MEKPRKLNWSKKIQENFANVIQSSDSKRFLSNFVLNGINHDQKSIDSATEFFTDFLINSAIKADENPKIKFKGQKKSPLLNWKFKKRQQKAKLPKWHDVTCEDLKRKLKQTSNLLKRFPKHPYLLGCLSSEQKQYKKFLESKHKEFINNLFSE